MFNTVHVFAAAAFGTRVSIPRYIYTYIIYHIYIYICIVCNTYIHVYRYKSLNTTDWLKATFSHKANMILKHTSSSSRGIQSSRSLLRHRRRRFWTSNDC